MTSLGAKLAARQQAELEAIERAAAAEAQAEQAEQSRRTKIVQDYFDSVRDTIVSVIEHGGKMPSFTIGKRDGWVRDSYELGSIMETYKDKFNANLKDPYIFYARIWMSLVDWGYENDLLITMTDDHDGMGRESWHVVNVAPNPHAF